MYGGVWVAAMERRVGLGLAEFRYCKTDTEVTCWSSYRIMMNDNQCKTVILHIISHSLYSPLILFDPYCPLPSPSPT